VDWLRQCLTSLACQTISAELFEVIVVDNRSTDGTQMMVGAFQREHPAHRVVLIYEPELGLGWARNAGWRQASGMYVAFIDDDAKADSHWLEHAWACFKEIRPVPVAVGGPILPYYTESKPGWFKDEYELRTWGEHPRVLDRRESLSGSNMIFQKGVLERFGGFDVRVGMRGKRISVGEETALFSRIAGSHVGDSLFYSPRLVVYHVVGASKMRASYHVVRAFAAGQVWYFLNGPRTFRERMRFIRMTLRTIRKQTATAMKQFRAFQDSRNWIIERIAPVALEIGRLVAGLGVCLPSWNKGAAADVDA
jgi:glycosyltransferase involved in cell wall biosynthesis